MHALVTEYRPGTPIGWHSDAPHFEMVVGISLAGRARMRFRPYVAKNDRKAGFAIELALNRRGAPELTSDTPRFKDYQTLEVLTFSACS